MSIHSEFDKLKLHSGPAKLASALIPNFMSVDQGVWPYTCEIDQQDGRHFET